MRLEDSHRLRVAMVSTAMFVAVLWWIKVLDKSFGWELYQYGIYPGRISGLIGVLAAPLIHGSIEHTVSNTLPMLLLGTALLYGYPRSRWWTIGVIWVVSGLGVWLWGRPSYHFGASGLTTGAMFYLFVVGVFRRDARSAVFSMLAFFMYGSMVYGIFPRVEGVSFEAHFFGAVGGVLAAIIFRNWDPKQPRKVYSYELEPHDAEDPLIGDEWKKGRDEKRSQGP